MDTLPFLETDNVLAQYDETKDILFVTYSNVLGSAETIQVYDWIAEKIETPWGKSVMPKLVGVVYDFQKVTQFTMDNLDTVQKKSQELNKKFDFSSIPVALIAANEDHAKLLEASIAASPQPERKKVCLDIENGIAFLRQFKDKTVDISSKIKIVDTNSVTCYYDESNQRMVIMYYGLLTDETSQRVYDWIKHVIDVCGLNDIWGMCFDFRRVTRFDKKNLNQTERLNQIINEQYDLDKLATAFVVRDYYQEQIIRMGMRTILHKPNKKIFRTFGEAYEFLGSAH